MHVFRSIVRAQRKASSDEHMYKNNAFKYESAPLLTNKKSETVYGGNDENKTHQSQPSLFKVIFKTYWRTWLLASFFKIISDVFALAQSLLLK
jgi:hypothetical protein